MSTLLRNGRIYGPSGPPCTALLIDGPVIAWVGTDEAAARLADDAERVVDLDGALVTPAFVDAHVHLTQTGLALRGVALGNARTITDVLDRVAAAPPDGPVLGSGWDEQRWPEHRPPTALELARAAGPDRLVYLARVDAHSAAVSTALLAQLPPLPGWRADGWLTMAANDAARRLAFAAVTADQRGAAQRAALTAAAKAGVGCVHEMAGPHLSSLEDLQELLALSGPYPTVIGYWGELGGARTAQRVGAVGAAGDIDVDGSIGSHTAAFHRSYLDADTCGIRYLDAEQVTDHVIACTQAGLQAGFHAIGDAAVDVVLDGMQQAIVTHGPAVRTAGHRIEHAEAVSDPQRMADVGLIASVQPAFDATWGGPAGMYATRLGQPRAGQLNDLAALAAAGVSLAFGSDSPITAFDPWAAVRAAAHPHRPDSAISTRAAFLAHTRGGWRAARRHQRGEGVIAPGSPATLAIWHAAELMAENADERVARWSTDPRSGIPELPDLRPGQALPQCLATLVEGTWLHGHDRFTGRPGILAR